MKKWGLFFLLLIYFPFIYKACAQNISNEGTDFWAVFPTHDPSADNDRNPLLANIRIYVTSKASEDILVTVSCGTFTQQKTIPSGVPVFFDVPRTNAYVNDTEHNTLLSQRGIHIVSNDGNSKIAVYAHIFAGFRSAASLILPAGSLGQQYYSMNYAQDNNGNSLLTLVATEANTRLLIHDNGIVTPVNFTEAGQVYEYVNPNQRDLTGVFVEVDPGSPDNCNKRFAAFSGSTSLSIGCENQRNISRDPLYQQLYPTTSWGKNYGIAPFFNRRYIVRVLAQEDDTKVQFNGSAITLNKGTYYTSTQLTTPSFVSADKKVSVAQYSLSYTCSGINGEVMPGDPEMVLLNPIEFNIKSVTLFSSTDQEITERYINVCIKTNAASSFRVNGLPVNGTWTAFPQNPEYAYIQLPVQDVSSNLTANDGFNAIAYGFGNAESYAYSAGTNLSADNYLLIKNNVTSVEAPNACINQESEFKIVLSYKATKITWTLDDGPADEYTPEPEVVAAADGPSYVYIYNKPSTFQNIAQHKMTVVAQMPNENNCLGGDIEYIFTFDVNPIPTADFATDTEACADTDIPFTDKSLSHITNKPINKWLWDFGDGNTSAEQHPKHKYSTSGTFTVSLSAGLDDGCMADAVPVNILIRPKIMPEFNVDAIGCVNASVLFTDQSAAEPPASIVRWHWNFGDGKPTEIKTNNQPFNYQYSQTGTYNITLTVETANGCFSLVKQHSITIKPLPKPDFVLPKICAEDDEAEFINTSADAEDGTTGLRYVWHFGDGTALPANNTSDQVNGTHQYPAAGKYQVTLTVINSNGCTSSTTKEFDVNGSQIIPDFDVSNKNDLCSNTKVIVTNTSKVNSGSITKLVWYTDIDGIPGQTITDDTPADGKPYELTYPAATTPADRQIKIRLVAYSGIKCLEETWQTVTLKSSPSIAFQPIPAICVNAGNIRIQQASETLGLAGRGIYSGPGIVNSDGTFNPQTVGAGSYSITYTFMADNGCIDSKTENITVYPIPGLDTEKDIYILAGGEKKVTAEATGNGLTYKWTPSTGLDRDDILDPVIKGEEDIAYTLTITSAQQCSISQKINVHILPSLLPANAFSPNGDGVNDTWAIQYIDTYPNVTVQIFTRYGEKIFDSKGYTVPFDGNYKNQQLPVGTYYYIINPNNGKKNVTGSLTLLR